MPAVKRAFRELRGDEGNPASLYSVPITPVLSRFAGVVGGNVIGPFALLKLHGSLNWYYSGRESYFGEPIFNTETATGWNTSHSVENVQRAHSDKTPLVIPPTFGKSSFFQNEIILTIWQNAWRAVTDADRLFCLGYSLPPSDLIMVHLLRGISFRRGQVVVVNRTADARHYRDLLPGIQVDTQGEGPEVITNFVDDLVAQDLPGP